MPAAYSPVSGTRERASQARGPSDAKASIMPESRTFGRRDDVICPESFPQIAVWIQATFPRSKAVQMAQCDVRVFGEMEYKQFTFELQDTA